MAGMMMMRMPAEILNMIVQFVPMSRLEDVLQLRLVSHELQQRLDANSTLWKICLFRFLSQHLLIDVYSLTSIQANPDDEKKTFEALRKADVNVTPLTFQLFLTQVVAHQLEKKMQEGMQPKIRVVKYGNREQETAQYDFFCGFNPFFSSPIDDQILDTLYAMWDDREGLRRKFRAFLFDHFFVSSNSLTKVEYVSWAEVAKHRPLGISQTKQRPGKTGFGVEIESVDEVKGEVSGEGLWKKICEFWEGKKDCGEDEDRGRGGARAKLHQMLQLLRCHRQACGKYEELNQSEWLVYRVTRHSSLIPPIHTLTCAFFVFAPTAIAFFVLREDVTYDVMI